jgi:hypothetical protein
LQKTDAYQFCLLWVEIKITMRVYLKNKWTWLLHGRDDLDRFTICRKLRTFLQNHHGRVEVDVSDSR